MAALSALCGRVRHHAFLINAELAAEIGKMLDETASHEFLAGFEELENKVNQGRGTAGQVVAQARESIANQRADLVRALAEYQDAIGRPEARFSTCRQRWSCYQRGRTWRGCWSWLT